MSYKFDIQVRSSVIEPASSSFALAGRQHAFMRLNVKMSHWQPSLVRVPLKGRHSIFNCESYFEIIAEWPTDTERVDRLCSSIPTNAVPSDNESLPNEGPIVDFPLPTLIVLPILTHLSLLHALSWCTPILVCTNFMIPLLPSLACFVWPFLHSHKTPTYHKSQQHWSLSQQDTKHMAIIFSFLPLVLLAPAVTARSFFDPSSTPTKLLHISQSRQHYKIGRASCRERVC